MQNFEALRALPPDPRASGGWELRPQTPKTARSQGEFLATRLLAMIVETCFPFRYDTVL